MSKHAWRIAVCDDVPSEQSQIISLIDETLDSTHICHTVTAFDSPRALLDAFHRGERYSLLLLDMMMDGLNGLELARELRAMNTGADIIFISANREMALYGYEVNAVRYLAKPAEPERLREALLYCHKKWREKKEILIPTERGQHRISLSDIQFVEAYDRGTLFVLANEQIRSRYKISEAEAMLPRAMFNLCHRAYIVNLSCVRSIRCYEFTLKNGHTIPIGKNRYNEVYTRFLDHLSD